MSKNVSKNSRLVYSTETGRVKPAKEATSSAPSGDGIVRLRRETKGRKGKGVTLVTGLSVTDAELKELASALKKLCGTGGSIKDSQIEIQGDQREKLKPYLEHRGFTVKIAGG